MCPLPCSAAADRESRDAETHGNVRARGAFAQRDGQSERLLNRERRPYDGGILRSASWRSVSDQVFCGHKPALVPPALVLLSERTIDRLMKSLVDRAQRGCIGRAH